ncbi:hypothetical protein EI94DRAFT_1813215 [Lactarius quietus]|nr:hypothetical protein EI94DRAFT_1813215 [Lactarius quietus]
MPLATDRIPNGGDGRSSLFQSGTVDANRLKPQSLFPDWEAQQPLVSTPRLLSSLPCPLPPSRNRSPSSPGRRRRSIRPPGTVPTVPCIPPTSTPWSTRPTPRIREPRPPTPASLRPSYPPLPPRLLSFPARRRAPRHAFVSPACT